MSVTPTTNTKKQHNKRAECAQYSTESTQMPKNKQ